MLKLSAKTRSNEKAKSLRKEGMIPVVLYGYEQENTSLYVNEKEFDKIFKEAGESSLISLNIEGNKKAPVVLISDTQEDPISGKIIHVDFYQPNLKEEVEAEIPLIFIGESPAVKDMDGTLVKSILEVEVKALPQNLPHDIKVDISKLETFEDVIQIKDLQLPDNVEIMHEPEWTVAMVSAPENVEEELEKPIDDSVDDVKMVDEKGKDEEGDDEEDNKEENKKEENKKEEKKQD